MSQNTAPVFSAVPNVSGANFGTAAANDFDGTSGNYAAPFTADATNGSYVERLMLKANGTNATGVARIFLNNGSAVGTASNNHFVREVQLPASTSSTTAPTAADVDVPLNIRIPAGYKILIGSPAALASGWHCTAFAGNY
jgi:hypothetical protein